jgi:hypothetical protein
VIAYWQKAEVESALKDVILDYETFRPETAPYRGHRPDFKMKRMHFLEVFLLLI